VRVEQNPSKTPKTIESKEGRRHRHRMVQMRTRIVNQLHLVALNEEVRREKAPWRPSGRTAEKSVAEQQDARDPVSE
jgi:hypothetical protein